MMWQSKKRIHSALRAGQFMVKVLTEMGYNISHMNICLENLFVLRLSEHDDLYEKSKHILQKYHVIRKEVQNKRVKLNCVQTDINNIKQVVEFWHS